MNFNFPKNKILYKGKLSNINQEKGNRFYDIDPLSPLDNVISIDNTEYHFTYLKGEPYNKGGNSIILELYDTQNVSINNGDEILYDAPDLILKILKFKIATNPLLIRKNEKRFINEISALTKCNEKSFQNVINIYHEGICKIWSNRNNCFESYRFYTMEYAEHDLKSYIEENHEVLSLEEKIELCISLAKGISELNDLGVYHRDLKPDNIFMVDNEWKIGDLGLIQHRNKDSEIDNEAELIGPRGWLSPEAMNKYLCEGKSYNYSYNCKIDHQSDIFQLGKIFWYIFQHNAPIGVVKEKDFKVKSSRLYSIIRTMLNYSKNKRYSDVKEIIRLMSPIQKEMILY